MATRYRVGGGGVWNSTSKWSTSSGGASGASVPGVGDRVIFNASSGFSGSMSVTMSGATQITSFDSSACSTSITLSGGTSLSVEENFIAHSGLRLGVGQLAFIQPVHGFAVTINLAGIPVGSNILLTNGGGFNKPKYTLGGTFSQVYPYTFNTNNCTFDSGNYNASINDLSYGAQTDVILGTSNFSIDDALNIDATATFSASSSTLTVVGSDDCTFSVDNRTFGTIRNSCAGIWTIYGNNTINTLTLDPNTSNAFQNGATQSVGTLNAVGSSGNLITLRSTTTGSRFTLSSASNKYANFLDLKDSAATGGGTWYAGGSSTNSGNNTGWSFTTPSVTLNESTSGTGEGTATLTFEAATLTESSTEIERSITSVITPFQALPQKEYEYRTFNPDGSFKSVWQNVTSDFSYSQGINQNATELNVSIGRSPDNRTVTLERLKDDTGADILDENSDPILVQTETANSVGEGTDIDMNLNVDVYAYYGGYEQLLDENSNPILDENSDPILVQFGAPNGKRVYSGYIADYELVYGNTTGVSVKVVPHATEMSHFIFKDGANTTVSYLNEDPVIMARDAMDNYMAQGGLITYNEATMPLSAESVDYDFKLQTTREAVDKSVNLLPSGWYHFAHPGENMQYLLSKGTTADHTFYYEKHIQELRLRKSITQLINKGYFIGGDVAGVPLFKYYEDATSITNYRPGLTRMSDSRVTLADSASILVNREIEEFKLPRYRTSVEISDAVYDIEEIRLGDMVAFKNFGTFVDDLLLQVVNISRSKHSVVIDLDMIVPNEAKRLEELKKAVLSEQIRDIADLPS